MRRQTTHDAPPVPKAVMQAMLALSELAASLGGAIEVTAVIDQDGMVEEFGYSVLGRPGAGAGASDDAGAGGEPDDSFLATTTPEGRA